MISFYWNDPTSSPHDSLWYVRWHVWLCECIVNVWMYFWIYVATPTWIGHNRTVLVIEVLGIVNWLGRPAPLFGGILRVKTFVDAKRAGTDGKKTIVIFQRPVFEEWMLPNFRDLAHNLECKKSKNTWHQLSHWISIKACCPTVLVQNTATPVSPRRKGQTADTPTLSHLIVTVYVWP